MTMKSYSPIARKLLLALSLVSSTLFAETALGQAGGGLIVSLAGDVQLQRANTQTWELVPAGTKITAGDVIRTGEAGKATVVLTDETLMRLNNNTTFLFREISTSAGWTQTKPVSASSPPSSSYMLERGEVWLRNKNRSTAIDVTSPTVSASIRGTEFNMQHRSGKQTVLSVLEGSVAASNKLGSIVVGRNEQVIAEQDKPLSKTVLLNPNDAVQWVLSLPTTLSPSDMPLQSARGDALAAEISLRERQLQSAPQDLTTLTALARLYRDSGNTSQAESLARKAWSMNARDAHTVEVLGTILLDRGEAIEAAQLLASVDAPSSSLSARLIMAQRLSNKPELARRTLNKALILSPNDEGLLLQRALLELDTAGPLPALDVLRKLTEMHPTNTAAWMFRALVELTLQHKETASISAEQAITISPESATAHIVKSQVLQAQFDIEGARAAVKKALQIDGQYSLALLNLAKLTFGSGNLEDSLATIDKAYKLYPNDAEIRNVRGFVLLSFKRSEEAKAEFEQAIKLQSGLGEPHLGLSLLAMRRGDAATALEEISSAVALEPRRSMFLSYWAKMLYQLRRSKQALDMLELASDLDPLDPTPLLYRAIILRDLNRPTEAIDALQTAFSLNNNRAVYRSTFLLDRDLAVKNIDLSILYNQLGLGEWALSSAVNSVKLDYLNHSAHIFLSGAYSELEARDTARDTELLLAQILLPANNNSFNTYNDYTSFIETPSYRGSISGAIGNQDTQNADVVLNGGFPEYGVAGRLSGSRSESDGHRETNPESSAGGAASLKIDPSLNDSVFLGIVSTESESADDFRSYFETDAPVDPLDKSSSRGTAATLGYRHRFSPQANLIAALQYSETWIGFDSHNQFDINLDEEPVTIDEMTDRDIEGQSYALQGQYQYRLQEHQFLLGTIFNWGDEDQYADVEQSALLDGELFPVNAYQTGSNQDQRFQGYYGYHIWNPLSWFSTELGLYYEKIKDAEGFSDTKNVEEGFNPRGGIIIRPSAQDTIRLAAYRYIVPFLQSPRFDPSDVAGILVYRNTLEATTAEEVALAWEHSWHSGFVGTSAFYLERESSFKIDRESERFFFDGKYRGSEIAVNQLLFRGAGLAASYRYLYADDEFDSDINREDHLVKVAVKFLDSSGVGARIAQTYRRENFIGGLQDDEDIWITDARISYEFPGKFGTVSLGVNNIFDEKFNWVTGTGNIIGREPSREILARLTFNF